MKLRNTLPFLVLALLVVPLLAACGSKTIDAGLTSYNIALSDDSANSGEITFHIHNDATDDLTHEFVIFKTDLPPDQLPLTDEGIVDEEGPGVTAIDEVEDIEPGDSADLTVNLEPGNYVLLCNIDSDEMHYQHGMHVAFTVN
jgi:uncharacterized cupredoxin-like copper-binding protein